MSVVVFGHGQGALSELVGGDPAVVVGDLFEAGDLQSLALLDDLDEGGGLGETVVRAGIQPRKTTLQRLHLQGATTEILLIDRRDL